MAGIHCFTEDYKFLVEGGYRNLPSEDEKLKILSDYEDGMSVKEIAAKYNRDEIFISRFYKSFGLDRRLDKIKKLLLSTFENDYEITSSDVRAFCNLNKVSMKTAIAALEKAGKKIIMAKGSEKHPQEVLDEIEVLYKQGKGATEISRLLGISKTGVYKHCVKVGLIKPQITDKNKQILDFVDACYNKPIYLTAAEMGEKLGIKRDYIKEVLQRYGVKKPKALDIVLKWLEMNIDPNTGYISPIHYRILAGRLNISQNTMRNIIMDNPQWHLALEHGVIRDTRDDSDISFLYQDEWDQTDDYEDIENAGEIEGYEDQFEEPAPPPPPPPPKRRAEPKTPIVTTGLRRSKPRQD
jgi:hypothetical protein